MHLYKRGNVYWVEYEANGKRYRQSCKTGRRDVATTFMNSIKVAAKMTRSMCYAGSTTSRILEW